MLLVTDGQKELKPVIAAGRFKLWLSRNIVKKYLLELEGVLLVDGEPCLVNQAATTIVSDIGSTNVVVPQMARYKLGD